MKRKLADRERVSGDSPPDSLGPQMNRRGAVAALLAAGAPAVLPSTAIDPDGMRSFTSPSVEERYRRLLADAARPGGGPLDDGWWARIAGAFDVGREFTVLGSVVRGIAPRTVIELADQETRRRNAYRPRRTADPDAHVQRRATVARFLGASPEETALVRNTTEGITTVLLNWPLRFGDEIVCSGAEHGPFYDTLAFRAARDGVTIRQVKLPIPASSADEIVAAYDALIGPRTRLVLLPHMLLYGQIMPVRMIADLVHARGGTCWLMGFFPSVISL